MLLQQVENCRQVEVCVMLHEDEAAFPCLDGFVESLKIFRLPQTGTRQKVIGKYDVHIFSERRICLLIHVCAVNLCRRMGYAEHLFKIFSVGFRQLLSHSIL